MAAHAADRPIAIGMGVAALAGFLLSLLTSDLSQWTIFTWLFAAVSLILAAVSFFYAFTGRSVIGQLPDDPARLSRVRTLALVALGAMVFVIILEIGGAITGSWSSSDWMFIGIYTAIGIMFLGRLAAIRKLESGTA